MDTTTMRAADMVCDFVDETSELEPDALALLIELEGRGVDVEDVVVLSDSDDELVASAPSVLSAFGADVVVEESETSSVEETVAVATGVLDGELLPAVKV